MKLHDAIDGLGHATQSAFGTVQAAITKLVEAARTSELTGLRNGLALEEDFASIQANTTQHHFLFGDLNGFKNINDSHSHAVGDAALRRAGTVLQMLADNWKATAYHKSGDEFAILVPTTHKDGLLDELGRYFNRVTLLVEDVRLEFAGSFGCTEIGDLDFQGAQERAESACQVAKGRGQDYVVHEWSPDDHMEKTERRFRCDGCGTSVRCTLTGQYRSQKHLCCPVCKAETAIADSADHV
jgi:diguanylate cyclase (GGDEF)-like protein